jgi:hypothetical protein
MTYSTFFQRSHITIKHIQAHRLLYIFISLCTNQRECYVYKYGKCKIRHELKISFMQQFSHVVMRAAITQHWAYLTGVAPPRKNSSMICTDPVQRWGVLPPL